jgi:hypothetical protein
MTKINLDSLHLAMTVIKGNIAGLEMINDGMIAKLQSTELFKDLTCNTLADNISNLKFYLSVLGEVKKVLEECGGEFPDTEPSIAQQLDTKTDGAKDIYQLGDRHHPIKLVGQGNNCKAIGIDPDFRSALSDAFGGYDIFG